MKENNLTKADQGTNLTRETTRTGERYISPSMDIFETEDGLIMIADVPGLSEENLNISVDQGILTIEGEANAGSGDFSYREFAMSGYWRQFQLPETLDAEKAHAEIKHGVLTLQLPKAEVAKPKRIEITVH